MSLSDGFNRPQPFKNNYIGPLLNSAFYVSPPLVSSLMGNGHAKVTFERKCDDSCGIGLLMLLIKQQKHSLDESDLFFSDN